MNECDDSNAITDMDMFEIFFSDLNLDAQKRLLKAAGINHPAEMNWDIDMCPIAMYPIPIDDKEELNGQSI